MNRYVLSSLLWLTAILLSFQAFAQKPIHKPKTFISIGDSIFWNRSLPVYLKANSSQNDEGVWLKTKNQTEYSNPIYFNSDGVNYIKTGLQTNNEGEHMMFPIYVDGSPPISTTKYTGAASYLRNGVSYFGKGLSVALYSKDKVSGLEGIYYAINNETYLSYSTELSFDKSGQYSFRYYGLDRVGNDEEVNEDQFTLDFSAPITTHEIQGPSFQGVYTSGVLVSFLSIDSLAGVHSIHFKLDKEDYQVYGGKAINLDRLNDGEHKLQYYAIDHVKNQETTKEFNFYLDKTAPLLAADILGDRFIVGKEVYFSGRTKLKFTAVDNKVGVKEIKYKVNNGTYTTYDQPFYLPSASGTHSIQYYAVDHLSNKTIDKQTTTGIHEFEHITTKVYVDLIGPNLSYDIIGQSLFTRDTLFVNKETKILLSAQDGESGLNKITYSLGGSFEEFDYTEALAVTNEGYYAIDFYGYDNVNNRNLSHLNVFSDVNGPEIFHFFSSEPYGRFRNGLPVFTNSLSIYLAATDDHVGLQTISYQINGEKELEYKEKLTHFRLDQKNTLSIKAIDVLGNVTTKQVEFYYGK